jgi:hypothetical protein
VHSNDENQAAISLLVLIYFFFSTGPTKVFKLLPWLVWGQLALDALMLVFWLAAAATTKLSCKDYCKACPDWDILSWNNRVCYCYSGYDYSSSYKRDTSPAPRGLSGGLEPRRSRGGSGSSSNWASVDARTALDAIMT